MTQPDSATAAATKTIARSDARQPEDAVLCMVNLLSPQDDLAAEKCNALVALRSSAFA
jgi:hypothetical protein